MPGPMPGPMVDGAHLMAARMLDIRGLGPQDVDLDAVAAHVRAGGLLAYPTETVYGFGSTADEASVERVRALKRRDAHRPLLLLVRDAADVDGLVWTDAARALADVFWPGALTLVLSDPRGAFPAGVRNAQGGVAVRVSPHPLLGPLLDHVGGPLTSTSANAPGMEPARSGEDAMRAAEALGAGPDMLVLGAGTLPPSSPSTIVDCTGRVPFVLRSGSVPLTRLRCALPEIHGR